MAAFFKQLYVKLTTEQTKKLILEIRGSICDSKQKVYKN